VTDNDPQNDQPQERVVTLRLTRSALTLIAALAFLACTILLITIFPPGGTVPRPLPTTEPGTELTPTSAVIAIDPTSAVDYPAPGVTDPAALLTPTDPAALTPVGEYPAPNTGAPGALTPDPLAPTADQLAPTVAGGYPAPDDPQAALQGTVLPTFAPDRGPPGEQETAIAQATAAAATVSGQPTFPTRTVPTTPAGQPPAPTVDPALQPTQPPVQPTQPPVQPTQPPVQPPPPTVPRPTAPPTATPINADLLTGNLRWTLAQSPVILRREQRLTRGSSLIIDPGVEVRLAPGVAFYVEGVLSALGQAGQSVRFVNSGSRWDGLYVVAGGSATFEHTELRGGGNGGTLIAANDGALTIRRVRVSDNCGQIRASGGRVEITDSEISGNDMPYGSAIEINAPIGPLNVSGNRVGGNRLAAGTAPLSIRNPTTEGANMTVQRNLLIGEQGPNLLLFTNGPLSGEISCNVLIAGTNGVQLKSDVPTTALNGLVVVNNVIDDHTPPIEPIYLKFGIGRGATSDLALGMANNYWGSELGPYDPIRHPDGRGDSVGVNITFGPWLTTPPACVPGR
jgi:hypothetical protein